MNNKITYEDAISMAEELFTDLPNNKEKWSYVPFDFNEIKDTLLKSKFESAYNFYQTNLTKFPQFNLYPNLFYFNNEDSFNAFARKEKGYSVISFNKGLVIKLHEIYENRSFVKDIEDLKDYEFIEKTLEKPISNLMYEISNHFSFYHELAHLVQDRKSVFVKTQYDKVQHIREIDADMFGSIYVCTHILQKFTAQFNNNEAALEKILALFSSSIFIYILNFDGTKKEFYTNDYEYSHPVFRAFCNVLTIFDYAKKYANIDIPAVLNETFRISHFILQKIEGQDNITSMFFDNKQKIIDYRKELIPQLLKDQTLSWYKRNQSISTQI